MISRKGIPRWAPLAALAPALLACRGAAPRGPGAAGSQGTPIEARVDAKKTAFVRAQFGLPATAEAGPREGTAIAFAPSEARKRFVMSQLTAGAEAVPGRYRVAYSPADPGADAANAPFYQAVLEGIHLRLHAKWSEGALKDFDRLGNRDPFGDPTLLVTLELVFSASGELERAAIARSSGELPFDAAAITAAYDAAPYPRPPRAVLSPDGRAYVHWGFSRGKKQCDTDNATLYILLEGRGQAVP
jgi:TonB family protein